MKKRFHLLTCIVITVLMLISISTPAFAANFNRASMDGVVFIYWQGLTVQKDNNNNLSLKGVAVSGSGFFVGKEEAQYVVTNCHVIQRFLDIDKVVENNKDIIAENYNLDTYNNTGKTLFPLYVGYDKNDFEEAYVVDYNKEKDIAILKIDKPTDKRTPLLLRENSNEFQGMPVWAIGFPSIADKYVKSVTSFGKSDATITDGIINRTITESGTGRMIFQTSAKVRAGNSGGPLVDELGNVLGINTFVISEDLDSNLNYAVSINELIPMLKNNNIEYLLSTNTSQSSEVTTTPVPTVKTTTTSEPKADSDLSNYLPFIIGGVLLLVTVMTGIILVSRKKKEKPQHGMPKTSTEVNSLQPQTSTPKVIPVLRSMSSQHAGITNQLGNQPVIIGRDVVACSIIFKEGTSGVSSKHCQIQYDSFSGLFILTDLNSTYGTFLSNGQKLQPGVPYKLNPKDSFYLGEQTNLIYVDLERA